jgi:hypothetical protein
MASLFFDPLTIFLLGLLVLGFILNRLGIGRRD